VATVEPVRWDRNWGVSGTDLGNLNNKIKEIADASTTDNIYFADIRNRMLVEYGAADFWDDVHLSQQGATKAANTWFNALVPVITNIVDNVPPSVAITAPTYHSIFTASASVPIQVTAEDTDCTISKVEFYNGNTKIGESTSAPYTFTWTHVDEGTFILKAITTNDLFAKTTSVAHTITVNSSDDYLKFTGTDIGSLGSWEDNGNTFAKALRQVPTI
jgi:hypothetical protein